MAKTKKYKFQGKDSTKRGAQIEANKWRKDGINARVRKVKGGYGVYTGGPSKINRCQYCGKPAKHGVCRKCFFGQGP